MMPAYAARLVSQGVAPPSLIRDGADLTGLSILERLGEVWSGFPLLDVHDGTIGSACSVGEAESLVQAASRGVGFIYADVHRVRRTAPPSAPSPASSTSVSPPSRSN